MNQNNREDQQRRDQIQELARQINQLSEQLNCLLIIENEEGRDQQLPNPPAPRGENEFRDGDRVRIRNNYRGLRGATGTVVNVTPQQVSIRLDGQSRIVNRKQTNVEIIE